MVTGLFIKENITAENCDESREWNQSSSLGTPLDDGRLQLSMLEALFLLEKGKLEIVDGKNKAVSKESFLKRASRIDPDFRIRYPVFKDLRKRGYIVKTALKFGADFRVYDRGVKPGDDHAKWVVFAVHETHALTWYEFAAKNRVAHSTKKNLLIGVVDDEGDVSYWEVQWVKP